MFKQLSLLDQAQVRELKKIANEAKFVDGKISKDQFEQHYREIATATPNDDYFVMAIEKEWGIKEDEDASVQMTEVMHIVKLLRQRLISLSNQN